MQYSGGKDKLAKRISSILNSYRTIGQTYVEPFMGGANIFSIMSNPKIGADVNPYIIAMWNRAIEGWIPEERVSEDLYLNIKENKEAYSPEIVGFSGVALSFAGLWFGGFATCNRGDDYFKAGVNSLNRQSKNMRGGRIIHSSYEDLDIPHNSLIYCDPPYKGTGQGYIKEKFDSEKFYDWCRKKSKEGHTIFVSEYSAPDDFSCIQEFYVTKNMVAKQKAQTKVEKLYLVGEATNNQNIF